MTQDAASEPGLGRAHVRAWSLVVLALVAAALFLASTFAPPAPEAPVVRVLEARVLDVSAPDRDARTISLPLHWDIEAPGRDARLALRLRFAVPPHELGTQGANRPWALLIPRLGQDWQLSLNGRVLTGRGEWAATRGDDAATWKPRRPVWVELPSSELRADNELVIALNAKAGQRSGLAAPWVGPAELLLPTWSREEAMRVTLPQAATLLSLIVAALCALIWTQHHDPVYAWAGLGELIWAMRLVDTWWEYAWLPSGAAASFTLLLFWCWGVALFGTVDALWDGQRSRVERRLHWALIGAGPPLLGLAWGLHNMWPVVLWMLLSVLFWGGLNLRMWHDTWRSPTLARWLVCAALSLTLVAIARDIYAGRVAVALYDETAWNKHAAVGFALSMLGVVGYRFAQAREALLSINRNMAERLAARERELGESFAQMARVQQTAAVAEERNRILRDIHDGAGAHLIAAIHQVESGRGSTDELLSTLRGSLDQLRLSIDAVNLPAGDLMAVLSSMRFRLARRLDLAGIALRWRVDELPLLPGLHAPEMRHLQFILLELISNAIQHSRCTTLRVSATVQGDGLVLELEDDGIGIQASGGNGLRNVSERATAIGAVLQWPQVERGTRVTLRLKVGPTANPGST